MAMRFDHEFTVPVPVEQAWTTLLDVERVAPCLPGATLESVEGDEITGRMRVKVGPITVTYHGTAHLRDVDKDARTVTVEASGKEARGAGTAGATVTARLTPAEGADGSTKVAVETSFNVTGRPAQFGRGVMAEVGGKLIDRFAANLAALLAESPEPAVVEEADVVVEAGQVRHLSAVPDDTRHDVSSHSRAYSLGVPEDPRPSGTARTSRTAEEEALDLLEIAGTPLLKRVAPAAGAVALLAAAVWIGRLILRRRRRSG
ncbi:SRPBCC family protein [Spongiactinospora sp. TRM90649]|uniref:SRPBCC family protein n=1 Tax=Spongiactinospora sp. TRM90649 TaxID=3031114 RepID=UPI0023F90F30|nr:SRPBCC family protein [Spongiactinospora sp. TRM90649]MDF5751349.1 SRPBCC family protein [Spongiactinospora sp. TRM90649]